MIFVLFIFRKENINSVQEAQSHIDDIFRVRRDSEEGEKLFSLPIELQKDQAYGIGLCGKNIADFEGIVTSYDLMRINYYLSIAYSIINQGESAVDKKALFAGDLSNTRVMPFDEALVHFHPTYKAIEG